MVRADGSSMRRPTKGELELALLTVCMMTRWGQPCFRTTNGVPMGMPKKTEKLIREVFKRLRVTQLPEHDK